MISLMPRLPSPRRRVAGISLLALVVVLAVLWALRRVPPSSPDDRREKPGPVNRES